MECPVSRQRVSFSGPVPGSLRRWGSGGSGSECIWNLLRMPDMKEDWLTSVSLAQLHVLMGAHQRFCSSEFNDGNPKIRSQGPARVKQEQHSEAHEEQEQGAAEVSAQPRNVHSAMQRRVRCQSYVGCDAMS
eukprot:3073751-Rhodomonas_salina.1